MDRHRRVDDREQTREAVDDIQPKAGWKKSELFPVAKHVREDERNRRHLGPVKVKSATMSPIQDGMDGETPFLRAEQSARDEKTHSEENKLLHQPLFSNEKTEQRRENAVSGKKDLGLFEIERLQVQFHAVPTLKMEG